MVSVLKPHDNESLPARLATRFAMNLDSRAMDSKHSTHVAIVASDKVLMNTDW